MLEHGGDIHAAIAHFGRPRSEWLDLSTGINPHHYPVPMLALDAWHRLPEADSGLAMAAAHYYGAPAMLPVAGTQAAIQALPCLRSTSRVVVAAPAYAEHAHCWARAGHTVREVVYAELETVVADCDVMVVCNPNNPTGATVAPQILLEWAAQLAARGGWLIVDEAFADTTSALSVAAWSDQPGLIVLRSVGKFFGLAGLRLGFVAAEKTLLSTLADQLGPWSVSGPAQTIGVAALSDAQWQQHTRDQLRSYGQRLHVLLAANNIESSGSALYQWWPEPAAQAFHQHMAMRGIWVRLFTRGAGGIRLGLPSDEAGWERLQQALVEWKTDEKSHQV
ncbi:threonine-phosphate decarboxylase CobD [Glaciimonas sp. CA11.2]|uniref:threonine-phosphate decarboxylase CobD n=1 Tax=Glaciimonas sp. CA11.2 TaxID=3048601 RepID=UPI002AB58F54|nr:threonine-phosphate decarboxylase CobD [Glaciimonas sp. CA11.2]MDY7546184.1 threonine-phosphate decarboxylase CobD [Glaciimonas sp. CA11.2]MEB0161606.1 threonine-phosphate decarboxylase CobD [Glaciimonas sp. CA11.2]